MSTSKMKQLAELGQSIWLDYINRDMIESGKLQDWIDKGLRGMTSNPSIFNEVISKGSDYDERIARLKGNGSSTFDIYDELTTEDIRDAADFFKPVYENTNGLDGYVSLEINPQLAYNVDDSIKEGKRLFEKVKRPNLMIKVPATKEGFPVVEALIAEGINVNVTLIFSVDQYLETTQAFFRGLQKLSQKTSDLSRVRSVASVFVSRIDSTVDKMLDEKISAASDREKKVQGQGLQGKAAVANSRLILAIYREIFASEKFQGLAEKKAAVQRVLWGSTSTKNPRYSDIKYVEELIASPTVNTVPEKTLLAFLDHGEVKEGLTLDTREAEEIFSRLKNQGISINDVCLKLLKDGVIAFEKAFEQLLASIDTKAKHLCTHN